MNGINKNRMPIMSAVIEPDFPKNLFLAKI